jgi:hypothetical protein
MIKVAKQLKVGPTEQFNSIYCIGIMIFIYDTLQGPVMASLPGHHVYMTTGEISKQNKEQ